MADYLIRPAETRDLDAVAGIYNRIHDAEEQGRQTIGWLRDVYPVRQTAQAALDREELYVLETEGAVLGAAILNRTQVITYAQGHWAHDAPEEQVFVLHTLVIAPEAAGLCGLLRGPGPEKRLHRASHGHQRAQPGRPHPLPQAGLHRSGYPAHCIQRYLRRKSGAAGEVFGGVN